MCTSLQSLDLSHCDLLTDAAAELLGKRQLANLSLAHCSRLSNVTAEHLSKCDSLQGPTLRLISASSSENVEF